MRVQVSVEAVVDRQQIHVQEMSVASAGEVVDGSVLDEGRTGASVLSQSPMSVRMCEWSAVDTD